MCQLCVQMCKQGSCSISFLPVLQVLVICTSMVVVAFVTLLQNPVLGSPSWLPLLLSGWTIAFVFTMVLQASLPLPDIQR